MELTLWTNCAMLHEPIKRPQMLGIKFSYFACSTHFLCMLFAWNKKKPICYLTHVPQCPCKDVGKRFYCRNRQTCGTRTKNLTHITSIN